MCVVYKRMWERERQRKEKRKAEKDEPTSQASKASEASKQVRRHAYMYCVAFYSSHNLGAILLDIGWMGIGRRGGVRI